MDRSCLISTLSNLLPASLAEELVDAFLELRQDVITATLGRSAPGKFAESFVQTLQYVGRGSFDSNPSVDEELRLAEVNLPGVDDGLRICAARVARAMYTLRNKRNIAHKGAVDPNVYDLRFLLAGAQWIMAELVRSASGLTMEEAGALIEGLSAPAGSMVEDFGGRRLVHGKLSVREEVLVLMHSFHPEPLTPAQISAHLDRRSPRTIRAVIREEWLNKLFQGDSTLGYRLTSHGVKEAVEVMLRAANS